MKKAEAVVARAWAVEHRVVRRVLAGPPVGQERVVRERVVREPVLLVLVERAEPQVVPRAAKPSAANVRLLLEAQAKVAVNRVDKVAARVLDDKDLPSIAHLHRTYRRLERDPAPARPERVANRATTAVRRRG